MKRFILTLNVLAMLTCAYAVDVTSAADLAEKIAADPAGSYTLTANIDCTDWATVDSFTGSIDGAGYEIQNLQVPMFNTIGGSGTFSNIVFKDATITSTAANLTLGVFANYFDGENFQINGLTFDGCSIAAGSNKGNLIGMIAGNLTTSAIVSNCVVKSTCRLSGSTNISIGGLVGKALASGAEATITFVQCENASEVVFGNATHYFGGITFNSETKGASSKFAYINYVDCTNRTTVTTSRPNSGFAGMTYWSSANNSSYMGAVSFIRCINYGSAIFTGKATQSMQIGGIAGDCSKGKFIFDSCINYGSLLSTNEAEQSYNIGGIVASVVAPIKQPVTITNCANLGDISGYYVGGIVGKLTHNASYGSTRWYINSCIQRGNITSRHNRTLPAQAIGRLTSAVTYPEIDLSGSLYQTDILIGGYGDGTIASSILSNSCVYATLSNHLVDGTDLATLNAYEECDLWKQGSNSPILKIMDDEPAPDIITVTFKDSADFNSEVIATYRIARGGFVIPPADPEHENYTFTNWSIEDFSEFTEDTEVVAVYLAGTIEYTVRFIDWDGSVIGDPQTVEYGNAAIAPADPARENYVFTGWDCEFSEIFSDTDVYATYVIANVDINNQEEFVSYLTTATVPDVTYHLKADVVVPEDWTSIDFIANLDGGGYTLYNYGAAPVFSTLYGTVSNLAFDGYNPETEAATEIKLSGDYGSFGVVADVLDGGTISNVAVRNYILKSGRYTTMGVIVARMRNGATICRVHAEETCTIRLSQSYAGGLVGEFARTEDYCPLDENGEDLEGTVLITLCDSTNSAPIVITSGGNSIAGGIVGRANVANSTYKFEMVISNCVNNASIAPVEGLNTTSEFHFGGIVGERNANTSGNPGVLRIIDSSNYGDIISIGGTSCYGGLIGYTYRSAKTEFIRCQNRGNIGGAVTPVGADLTTGSFAGFIGRVSDLYAGSPFSCVDCANYGDIAGGAYAGGYFGRVTANGGHQVSLSLVNCANYGTTSIVDTEGGAQGQVFAAFDATMTVGTFKITVSNCLFTASDFYGRIAEQTKENVVVENVELNQVYVNDNRTIQSMAKTLDTYAQENAYEPWVLGAIDDKIYPELQYFAERIATIGTYILLR